MSVFASKPRIEIGPSGKPLRRKKLPPAHRLVEPYLYLVPTFVLIATFQYKPFFTTILYSFSKVNASAVWKGFIGFSNYVDLFTQEDFVKSLLVTGRYMILYVPGHILLALTLALMANHKRLFSNIYQTMYALPMAVSMSASCLIFQNLFNERTGIINWVLVQLHVLTNINDLQWFKSEFWALPGIIILSLWTSIGFHFMLLLAAIRGVPSDLMENADLAGANWFQRIWYITLPMISPTMFFVIIMTTIGSIGVVTPINIITQGGPNGSTTTLMYFIFQQGYRNQNYMQGSAGSIILFLTMLAFTLFNFLYEKKGVFYG